MSDRLEEMVTQLISMVAHVSNELSIVKMDLAELKRDVAVLKRDVAVLRSDLEEFRSEMYQFRIVTDSNFNKVYSEVHDLRDSVKFLTERSAEHEIHIFKLKKRMDNIN